MGKRGSTELGYSLSCEEIGPRQLVANARRAEAAGFRHALISDHFHPWLDVQGESPFVWSVIGAIAEATESLELCTGVTCPLIRIHPALVAQAAATSALLLPERFFLCVGTGENLNEHVTGARWPSHAERVEMLEEAVAAMRELWEGGLVSRRGTYFTVDRARLYSVPERPPAVVVAAAGPKSAALAGRIGDGLISTTPDPELVEAFEAAGGRGKPKLGQLTVCVADTDEEAVQTALEHWPNAAIQGDLGQELALPRYFRQAGEMVAGDDVAEAVVCSADPDRHREAIAAFEEAGFDRVYVHQVGTDQDSFFELYERELLAEAAQVV